MDLMTYLTNGHVVLMDGAMGTELDRRGVPMHGKAWSGAAMTTHPDAVRGVHEDYARGGAHMHITNSFALARHVLEPAGFGADVERFNTLSVSLCRDALRKTDAAAPQWLAGSLSTFAAQSDRSRLPDPVALRNNYAEQAQILIEGGVDLFTLEMLCDAAITKAALDAVLPFGRPVILGFTCKWGNDGKEVLTRADEMGLAARTFEPILREVLNELPGEAPIILSIMHSDLDVTDAALEILRKHWNGPVAVYPNSGHFTYPHWQFGAVCSPEAFVDAARRWMDRDVAIIGGCCGIGPDHIAALGAHLEHAGSTR
jgi:S-methylmethionine-dependent homocysteine/selenocysteine methylase